MAAQAVAEEKAATPAHMATTTVKVDGMTCGACTSAVEAGFKGVDGVGTVSVSLVMGRAVIQHDPLQLPAEKVAEIIEDRGFDAEVISTTLPVPSITELPTTTIVSISGMTCGACTSAVEGAFKNAEGLLEFNISLLAERATIVHEASKLTTDQIVEKIEDAGFDASVVSSTSGASQQASGQSSVTTTVSISGMTCGACTSAVEGSFKGVEGLLSFNISLLAERAVIVHDPSKLSTEQIVESIEDAGFDAKVVSSQAETGKPLNASSTAHLKIYGLMDGSAATELEDMLREKSGVESAMITLSTSRATITYSPSLIGLRALVEFIEASGYNALVADQDDNNAQLESLAKTKEIQEWRRSFIYSLSFAIPVFAISMLIPMFLPALDFGKATLIPGLFLGDVICLLLTLPVQFGIGKRFYRAAFKSLQHGSPTMDVLVVLGTSAAFFFSVFAMIVAILFPPHARPSIVFDTSTMLITFITLGRWLENRAKGQTSAALSRLMSLAPSMSTIYDDPIAAQKASEGWDEPFSPFPPMGGKKVGRVDQEVAARRQAAGQKVIPTELLQVGDIVILRPGDKVPADGIVTRGESYVDEAMVTGEAMHILKKKGSNVIAGTVNQEGRVDFRVTRAGKDTQLSQIVNLVQEAQTSRAPIQRLADKIAGIFVPAIIVLGLVTFTGWMILSHVLPDPPKVFEDDNNGGKFMVCLKLCISVIVFACPCALGLATPTAVMVGTGTGAEHGILVKGGATLETATKITHVVLDKTGTLTMGKMTVTDASIEPIWSSSEWRKRLWWTIVGLAEMSSEHPVAKSIVKASKAELRVHVDDSIEGSLGDFENTVGKGISATVEPVSSTGRIRYQVLAGNAQLLAMKDIKVPANRDPDSGTSSRNGSRSSSPAQSGVTAIHIAIDGKYAGTLSLSDELKPSAPAAIAALHKMGISTSLVTGDTYNTAASVAKLVGIPQSAIRASVLPHQKQEIVAELKAQGETVAMVGDGVNDSPALACANVGIALSSGTDVAMEAADIVLMRAEDLLSIPASLHLSQKIFKRIQTNLFLSCIYNAVGLPFAMGVFLPFGNIMLHPMAAGAAMAASSVTVVTNSLLLKLWKRPSWMTIEALEREIEKSGGVGMQPVIKARGRGSIVPNVIHSVMDGVDNLVHMVRRKRDGDDRADVAYVPLTTVEA